MELDLARRQHPTWSTSASFNARGDAHEHRRPTKAFYSRRTRRECRLQVREHDVAVSTITLQHLHRDRGGSSDSDFSFLQSPTKPLSTGLESWRTRCCRMYTPTRMLVACLLIAAAVAASVLLGYIVSTEFNGITPTPNRDVSSSSPPILTGFHKTTWDAMVFSLPNTCRILSLLSVTSVLLYYTWNETFRFNAMPLMLPLLLSQLGLLTSKFLVAVASIFSSDHVVPVTTTAKASRFVYTPVCKPTVYCGLTSSILSTTFNLSQIAFTVAITWRLLQSVGTPVEALCDTRHIDKQINRWIIGIVALSCAVAVAITFATEPPQPPSPTACQYNPWVCTSAETQLLNNMVAPAIGLGTVTALYFRIRANIHDLYPANARRTFKSVATYLILVFVVTWGISLFSFSLLTVLRQLPDPTLKTRSAAAFAPPSRAALDAIKRKVQFMLLTFVPYDLQGFLTSVVAICSYFRLRTRFDLGLSLKAINPSSIEFDEPLAILGQGAFAVVVKATWFPSRQLEYGTVLGCLFPTTAAKSSTSTDNHPRRRPMSPHDNTSVRVAVKTFKLERNGANSTLNGIQEEAYLASKLIHPNIMATYGCYTVGSTLYLVCEYLGGGTLQDVIDTAQPLPYEQVLLYALQIASGMEFLHGLAVPVIHRDLKPLNCCFDQTHSTLKLVDFGFSRLFRADPKQAAGNTTPRPTTCTDREMESRRTNLPLFSSATSRFSRVPEQLGDSGHTCPSLLLTSRVGTVCWAAPEVLSEDEQTRYSLKVDVYSFGIICWQLYTGKQPFSDIPGSVLAVEEAVLQGTRPRIPDDCPVHFAKLMRRAWHANPDRRPSFVDVVRVLAAELNQFHMFGTVRSEPKS
ncbi:hypothetical protein DYB31_005045, partial [Aphanomyces astaci]